MTWSAILAVAAVLGVQGTAQIPVPPGVQPASFSAATSVAIGPGVNDAPEAVVVAHFNADGFPDLATANYASSSISIALGTSSTPPAFGAPTSYGFTVPGLGGQPVAGLPFALVASDFNNDGFNDVLVYSLASSTLGSSSMLVLMVNDGLGAFTPSGSFFSSTPGSLSPQTLAVGNFNADAAPDLLVATASGVVQFLNINNTLVQVANIASNTQVTSVMAIDLNGDGIDDVAFTGYVANVGPAVQQAISPLLNPAVSAIPNPLFGGLLVGIGAGDFNGDGAIDIAAADVSQVHIVNGSTVAYSISFPIGTAIANNDRSLAVADVTGDGVLDILAANDNGSVSVLRNIGPLSFTADTAITLAPTGRLAMDATTDFDGDGGIDVVLAQSNSDTVTVGLDQSSIMAWSFMVQQVCPGGRLNVTRPVFNTATTVIVQGSAPLRTIGVWGSLPVNPPSIFNGCITYVSLASPTLLLGGTTSVTGDFFGTLPAIAPTPSLIGAQLALSALTQSGSNLLPSNAAVIALGY